MDFAGPLTPEKVQKILHMPASTPPANAVQNLENPPNGNKLALGMMATCVVFSTVLAILRVYSRLFCAGRVKLEDYMGVLGFAFFIASTCVLALVTSDAGLFVNMWNLRWNHYESFIYAYVINSILLAFALAFIKMAIILEWTHIFIPRSTRNMFFWTCYILISANVCLCIATVTATNLLCTPRETLWRRWMQLPGLGGSCNDINAFNISINMLHLASDILLLLLPHAVIWTLSMSSRQKLGVSFVFSVGILLCACAAGRVASAIEMKIHDDKAYALSKNLLWGLGECTSTILVFCAPAIPIILNRGGRISKHKMSRVWSAGQRIRSSENRQHPWPRIASNSTAVEEYHRMHEESATRLTELGQSISATRSIQHQEEEHPLQTYLGILKTTEIEITTHTETDLPSTNQREEGVRHPWRIIRAES